MVANFCRAQVIERILPKTFWTPNDTVITKCQENTCNPIITPLSRYPQFPTQNINFDARPNKSVTLYFGNDSLRLFYSHIMPYGEYISIRFESPKGKKIIRIGFESTSSYFPRKYIARNEGNVQTDIPEVYELANIIWTLSPSGNRAKDLYKEGPYYQRVLQYFAPFLNHPVFQKLDFPDSLYFKNYYSFRENSFCYSFKNNKLAYDGPYYYVMGDDYYNFGNLFKELLTEVEDFAKQSNFRKFYQQNSSYYASQIQRQQKLLPVKSMWIWLEANFPSKYNSYRIVFSPLIAGSHSTQNFWENGYPSFGESVMFICGPERYDSMKELSEKQKEGLMSGIVFTEIDHNYVNPVTSKYARSVDSIFSNRSLWVSSGNASEWYGNPVSVFNEYMTHAVFCLYMMDTYSAVTADFVIEHRENLMVSRRNFIRFKEFNHELMRIHKEDKSRKAADLYLQILEWCKNQK